MWMNDADDFCLWAPPEVGNIGDTEQEVVAWCTKSGRGTRIIPDGTLSGVHFVRTPNYVQVTGVGNFTMINVAQGDGGGGEHFISTGWMHRAHGLIELDPHGAGVYRVIVIKFVLIDQYDRQQWESRRRLGLGQHFRAQPAVPRVDQLHRRYRVLHACLYWQVRHQGSLPRLTFSSSHLRV
jgi:hypothetical protein